MKEPDLLTEWYEAQEPRWWESVLLFIAVVSWTLAPILFWLHFL